MNEDRSLDWNVKNQSQRRCVNFTSTEIARLVRLVEPHSAVVFDLRNGTESTREKARVWEEIATEFNREATEQDVPRTAAQLRLKWKNTKRTLHMPPNQSEASSDSEDTFEEETDGESHTGNNTKEHSDADNTNTDAPSSPKKLEFIPIAPHSDAPQENPLQVHLIDDPYRHKSNKERINGAKDSETLKSAQLRHAMELHKQALRHREELHTLRMTQLRALHRMKMKETRLKVTVLKKKLGCPESESEEETAEGRDAEETRLSM